MLKNQMIGGLVFFHITTYGGRGAHVTNLGMKGHFLHSKVSERQRKQHPATAAVAVVAAVTATADFSHATDFHTILTDFLKPKCNSKCLSLTWRAAPKKTQQERRTRGEKRERERGKE